MLHSALRRWLDSGDALLGPWQQGRDPLEQALRLTVSQIAPMLPYLFMVLILILRPRGLMGKREE